MKIEISNRELIIARALIRNYVNDSCNDLPSSHLAMLIEMKGLLARLDKVKGKSPVDLKGGGRCG